MEDQESYTKKQLLEVLRTKDHNKTFRIDCISEEQGHRILRLPPYHCVFNPIELIWSELKAHIRRNNIAPKFTANPVNVIRKEDFNITPASWSVCVM